MTTQYPRKSIGHVLHYLREWGVPETVAGRVTIGDSQIMDGNEHYASYRYFQGIEQPLFNFDHPSLMAQRLVVDPEKRTIRPEFRLVLSTQRTPGFVITGWDACQKLRDFISKQLFTSIMSKPGYRLTREAGAYFQGGYMDTEDSEHGFIYIEFWQPEGAQAWLDYLNAHYKPDYPK